MNQKTFKILEFDRIIAILKEYANSEPAKDYISNICPYTEIDIIRKELEKVDEALVYIQKYGYPPNMEFTFIDMFIKKVEIGSTLSPYEIIQINRVLRAGYNLKGYFNKDENFAYLKSMKERLIIPADLMKKIDKTFLSPDEIADDASEMLYQIRTKIRRLQAKIRDELNELIRNPRYSKYLQEAIVTIRGDRFVIPVKAEYRSEIKGIIHDQSATGSTLFIEPMASVELNNQIRVLLSEEREEIERILEELSKQISLYSNDIKVTYNALIELDVNFAKAKYALNIKATKPQLNENGQIILKKARHPLIPLDKVVSNDIELGIRFDALIITGPNTGGKTVTLKTVGLLTIMAQCALFVPCQEGSLVSVFENIFADIGDEQSISQSLSTFSSHMKNIIDITNNCNDKTLVLIDEIGAGTDPEEGSSLGKAILEYLYNNGAKIIATTHYGELKIFAQEMYGFENASCEFDVQTLKPTYRLMIGVPGRSNAITIASNLGLNDEIVSKAKSYMSVQTMELESIINDMEQKRQIAEQRMQEVESLKNEINLYKQLLEQEKEKIEKEKERVRKKAHEDAKEYVNKVKYEIDELLKALKKKAEVLKEKESIKELEEHSKKFQMITQQFEDSFMLPKVELKKLSNVKLGQEVYVRTLDTNAIVESLPDSKGNLLVRAGILKVTVNIEDIGEIFEEEKVPKAIQTRKKTEINKKAVPMQLDIRGFTSDDAILTVDKYLDDAYIGGLREVTIIHGKGTGALRTAIRSYLKRHSLVKSFRDGTYGEGEQGVTVVTLKD
ncbi:endonuclease MutS2 [Caldicellulosiruptoraceae bacterium PP1]